MQKMPASHTLPSIGQAPLIALAQLANVRRFSPAVVWDDVHVSFLTMALAVAMEGAHGLTLPSCTSSRCCIALRAISRAYASWAWRRLSISAIWPSVMVGTGDLMAPPPVA